MKQGGSPLHLTYPAAHAVPPLGLFRDALHGAQLCYLLRYPEVNIFKERTWFSLLLLYHRSCQMAFAYADTPVRLLVYGLPIVSSPLSGCNSKLLRHST